MCVCVCVCVYGRRDRRLEKPDNKELNLLFIIAAHLNKTSMA